MRPTRAAPGTRPSAPTTWPSFSRAAWCGRRSACAGSKKCGRKWQRFGAYAKTVAKALRLRNLCPEVERPLLFFGKRNRFLLRLGRLLSGGSISCDLHGTDVERFGQILAMHRDAQTSLTSGLGLNIRSENPRGDSRDHMERLPDSSREPDAPRKWRLSQPYNR
jgi:hypothetical protein